MALKPLKTLNFGGEDTYFLKPEWKNIAETTTYGDTLTWDGNTEGLTAYTDAWFGVTNIAPLLEDLSNGVTATLSDGTETECIYIDKTEELGCDAILITTESEDDFAYIFANDCTIDGVNYSKGIYLLYFSAEFYTQSLTINGYNGFEMTETVPLPNKYLDFIETVGGDTLTWDGDTEGLELVAGMMAHVSDAVPTNISSGNFELVVEGTAQNIAFDSTSIVEWATGINAIMHMGDMPVVILVSETGVGVDLEGLLFPKAGTYFCWMESGAVYTTSLTINGYTGFTKTQIKEEYVKDVILAVLEEKGLLS